MDRHRVVVTGLGGISALGCDPETIWEGLVSGRSGIDTITGFDPTIITSHIAGEARAFDPLNYFPKPEARKMDRFTQFAAAAAGDALKDAGLDLDKVDRERVGCILGTGIGGIIELESQKEVLMERGASRVSPFLVPKMMPNAISVMSMVFAFGAASTFACTVSRWF